MRNITPHFKERFSMRTTISFMLLSLTFASPAWALNCDDPEDQATMNACASQDHARADKELNAVYHKVTGRLTDEHETKSALVKAQRAWIAYRDAECDFRVSGMDGGTAAPMVGTQCRTELTEDRSRALQSYLDCEEGDLSCPLPAGD